MHHVVVMVYSVYQQTRQQGFSTLTFDINVSFIEMEIYIKTARCLRKTKFVICERTYISDNTTDARDLCYIDSLAYTTDIHKFVNSCDERNAKLVLRLDQQFYKRFDFMKNGINVFFPIARPEFPVDR